jgi:hypothetical protein
MISPVSLELGLHVLGHPVRAVLTLAGPDVVLAAQRGGHHLERREGAELLLVHELAAHRHPVVLDGQLELAAVLQTSHVVHTRKVSTAVRSNFSRPSITSRR